MARRPDPRLAGFTLVEFLVSLALVALVLAMAIPAVSGVRADGERDRLVELVESCRSAVRRHYVDTGALARESSRPGGARELSSRPATPGWNGPYLEAPLDEARIGATRIEIHADFSVGPVTPRGGVFILGETTAARLGGAGQYLAVAGISRDRAAAVDGTIDAARGGDWTVEGAVQWVPDEGGTLLVLLIDV